MKTEDGRDVTLLIRNAKEIIKHGGNCSEADLTCINCPISVPCLSGKLAGKTRATFHKKRREAAEQFLAK